MTPTTNIIAPNPCHAERQPHREMTTCVSGARAMTPAVSAKNTSPVARPRYRWNHFPMLTDVPIFTPP